MVNPLKILNEGCQIIKDNTEFFIRILLANASALWLLESVFPIVETRGSTSVR